METDGKWIIVRIDGKLAGISRDYGRLADIAAHIAKEYPSLERATDTSVTYKSREKTAKRKDKLPYREVTAKVVTFEDVLNLRLTTRWEDLILFGTDFQKKVWRALWRLSHTEIAAKSSEETADQNGSESEAGNNHISQAQAASPHLLSYSDFADFCDNKAGVRAVAHAVGLNPLPVIIPCHLIVPKESIDKIRKIQKKAEDTIFKGEDLCIDSILNDPTIDFGEYALGRNLKRKLIQMELGAQKTSARSHDRTDEP